MTRFRRPPIVARFLAAILFVLWSFVGCGTRPTATADPHGTELLRKAAAFVEAQKTFRLLADVEIRIEAQGQKQELTSAYLLSVARPDRLAMRLKHGENGVILVTDGKQFSRGIPVLKKYVVGEAPASLHEVFNDQAAAMIGMQMGGAFFKRALVRRCI